MAVNCLVFCGDGFFGVDGDGWNGRGTNERGTTDRGTNDRGNRWENASDDHMTLVIID